MLHTHIYIHIFNIFIIYLNIYIYSSKGPKKILGQSQMCSSSRMPCDVIKHLVDSLPLRSTWRESLLSSSCFCIMFGIWSSKPAGQVSNALPDFTSVTSISCACKGKCLTRKQQRLSLGKLNVLLLCFLFPHLPGEGC